MPQISVSSLTLLALVCISVLFSGLGSARLWDRDEPRNARASHEMLSRGDWIVPTFNGELRTHKPILLYWGQMVSYLALGESEFTARLPSAISALLAILAVAILATRLSGMPSGINREGYWAAASLSTCLLFVMAGRAATPDACLIGFSTAGIAALIISTLAPSQPYSSGRVGAARWLPALFGYVMLGLATLAKGPVGFILPLAVVHAWWLVCDRLQSASDRPDPSKPTGSFAERCTGGLVELWRTFGPWQCLRSLWLLKTIPGVLVILLAAAPWYVAVGLETNGDFLRGFFLEHNLGRAVNSMEGHRGSIFFYPLAFLVGTFPWSLWLLPVIVWARKASFENPVQRQMIILSLVWIVVYITAFSLASTKLPSYITPCYAGASLLLGGYWRQFESLWAMPARFWRTAANGLAMAVGCAIGGGLLWVSAQHAMPLLSRAAACGAVIALVGCVGLLWDYLGRPNWIPRTWLIGAAGFQVLLFGLGARNVDFYRQDLQTLVSVQQTSHGNPWLSVGGMEPSWVYYLNQEIVEVRSNPADSETWERVREFLAKHPAGNIILVGDAAQAAFLAEPDMVPLVQAGGSPRFLRSGTLAIYHQAPTPIPSDQALTSHDNLATPPSRNAETLRR